jgi:hypothetical protein
MGEQVVQRFMDTPEISMSATFNLPGSRLTSKGLPSELPQAFMESQEPEVKDAQAK